MSRYLSGSVILICCLAFVVACDKDRPVVLPGPGWGCLGFDNHWAVELKLDWPYLYACAADEGLFRMRLDRRGSGWQYVGLADTSLADTTFGHFTNRGVLDVLSLGSGELLAGIIPGITYVPRIYRSSDDGNTWAPSDTCVGGYPCYPCMLAGVHSLERSPCVGDVILAGASGAIFRSTDKGLTWVHVGGIIDTGLGVNDIRFHPMDCSLLWAVGETSFFEALLMKSTDHGETWQRLDTRNLRQYGEGLHRIALHPTDMNVLYISLSGSVVKSTDGGTTWTATAFPMAFQKRYRGLVLDPVNPDHMFAAAKQELFESWDGGLTVQKLEIPEDIGMNDNIRALEYHGPSATLYIGSLAGVFSYRQ